jgi:hypothetical protein
MIFTKIESTIFTGKASALLRALSVVMIKNLLFRNQSYDRELQRQQCKNLQLY